MSRAEGQHVVNCSRASGRGAGHGLLAQDETERGHFQGFEDRPNVVEPTVGGERIEETGAFTPSIPLTPNPNRT